MKTLSGALESASTGLHSLAADARAAGMTASGGRLDAAGNGAARGSRLLSRGAENIENTLRGRADIPLDRLARNTAQRGMLLSDKAEEMRTARTLRQTPVTGLFGPAPVIPGAAPTNPSRLVVVRPQS